MVVVHEKSWRIRIRARGEHMTNRNRTGSSQNPSHRNRRVQRVSCMGFFGSRIYPYLSIVHCPYLYDITACLIEPVPQDDGIQKVECRGDPTGQFDLILLEWIIQKPYFRK